MRSFKSAPAQNAESALLASTKALVGPFPCSAAIASTWKRRVFSSSLDIAFLALGLLSKSTRTYPDPGAGTCWMLIRLPASVAVAVVFVRTWKHSVLVVRGRIVVGRAGRDMINDRAPRGGIFCVFVFCFAFVLVDVM